MLVTFLTFVDIIQVFRIVQTGRVTLKVNEAAGVCGQKAR